MKRILEKVCGVTMVRKGPQYWILVTFEGEKEQIISFDNWGEADRKFKEMRYWAESNKHIEIPLNLYPGYYDVPQEVFLKRLEPFPDRSHTYTHSII